MILYVRVTVLGHTHALLLLLFCVARGVAGKNSWPGLKAESGGDSRSSRRLSENCSGRWLVIWVAEGLLGSEENRSTWSPNRPPLRWADRTVKRGYRRFSHAETGSMDSNDSSNVLISIPLHSPGERVDARAP